MSMDSRIANKDKTILSLQLEELEPVFMGKKDEGILVWKILHFIAVHLYLCSACLHNLLLPKNSGASYISGTHPYMSQTNTPTNKTTKKQRHTKATKLFKNKTTTQTQDQPKVLGVTNMLGEGVLRKLGIAPSYTPR